eukprot:936340_1
MLPTAMAALHTRMDMAQDSTPDWGKSTQYTEPTVINAEVVDQLIANKKRMDKLENRVMVVESDKRMIELENRVTVVEQRLRCYCYINGPQNNAMIQYVQHHIIYLRDRKNKRSTDYQFEKCNKSIWCITICLWK